MTVRPNVTARDDDVVELVDVGDPSWEPDDNPGEAARGFSVRLAAVALVITLAAATVSVVALYRRSRPMVRTTVVTPVAAASVDASGCPISVGCVVSSEPERGLFDALRAGDVDRYPNSGSDVFESATGRSYRTSVTVQLPSGSILSVAAQCIPHGESVQARRSVPTVGPADAVLVVPGAPGCSVTVAARVPAGVPVPANLIDQIGHDPGAQLAP